MCKANHIQKPKDRFHLFKRSLWKGSKDDDISSNSSVGTLSTFASETLDGTTPTISENALLRIMNPLEKWMYCKERRQRKSLESVYSSGWYEWLWIISVNMNSIGSCFSWIAIPISNRSKHWLPVGEMVYFDRNNPRFEKNHPRKKCTIECHYDAGILIQPCFVFEGGLRILKGLDRGTFEFNIGTELLVRKVMCHMNGDIEGGSFLMNVSFVWSFILFDMEIFLCTSW